MTPEEKFNNDLLYVLNRIKEKSLYTLAEKPIEYWINYNLIMIGEKYTSAENEALIIRKLQELEVIKIINEEESSNLSLNQYQFFNLKIIQPKFNELYEKLGEPLIKKEKYQQSSAESIKKILGTLGHLKDEWDLTPKGNYNETSISPQKYRYWMQECDIGDFYELNNILTILEQEGLILKADFIDESR